jgi:hypothetical protein
VHDLEGRQPRPHPRLRQPQKAQRRVRVRHHHQRRPGRGGLREKPQRRRRDDAQRPLRPDHQVAQVVAHVVLAQARQRVHHAAIGQHRLDPEAQVARIAVAQHVDPARIGRQKPADPGRALRGERQRKDQVLRLRRGVDIGQDRAPASTVMVPATASKARIARIRSSDRITGARPPRPVARRRGPCRRRRGSRACGSRHRRGSIAATSAVSEGATTRRAWPCQRPRGSSTYVGRAGRRRPPAGRPREARSRDQSWPEDRRRFPARKTDRKSRDFPAPAFPAQAVHGRMYGCVYAGCTGGPNLSPHPCARAGRTAGWRKAHGCASAR